MENIIIGAELLGGLVLVALIFASFRLIANRHAENTLKKLHIIS